MLEFTYKLNTIDKLNKAVAKQLVKAKEQYDTFTDEEKIALDAFPLTMTGVSQDTLSDLMASLEPEVEEVITEPVDEVVEGA